jgi:hypothetical protein
MNWKKRLVIAAIVLIISLGVSVRLIGLETSPYSINFDEAALGYNAYSIMKTGKDEYGRKFPVSLRSFNDYKPALYSYLSIPPIKIWGLNQFSTRFISALAGSLQLVLLYLLAKKFTRNINVLLVFMLLTSFSPWGIHFSRVAFESNLSTLFFLAGSILILTSHNKMKTLLFSTAFFTLAAYSYHSARLAAPALLLLWAIDPIKLLLKKKNPLKNINYKKIAIPFLLTILLLPLIFSKDGTLTLTRLRQTNLFNRLYPFVPRELITNKNPWLNFQAHPIYYLTGIFLGHIFGYFSPINLTVSLYHWVKNSPQAIPEFSMLGWEETVLFVVGLLVLLKKIKKEYKYRHLVYWIIAGSLPAALTWTWFHPLRALNIFPAIAIVFLLGIQKLHCILAKHFRPSIATSLLFLFALSLIPSRVFIVNNELVYSSWKTHGQYQPGGFKEGNSKKVSENNNRQPSCSKLYLSSFLPILPAANNSKVC